MLLPVLVVVAVKAAKLPSAISPTSTHSTEMVRSTFRRLVFLVLVIWALPSSLVGSPVAARRLPRPWGLPVDRLLGRRLERLGAVPGRSAPGDRGRGVHGSPRRPLAVPGLRRHEDADGLRARQELPQASQVAPRDLDLDPHRAPPGQRLPRAPAPGVDAGSRLQPHLD